MNTDIVAWTALAVAALAMLVAIIAVRQHERIRKLEGRIEFTPDAGELAGLREKIATITARQEAVFAEAHAARASIRRVEDFLLKVSRSSKYVDSQF